MIDREYIHVDPCEAAVGEPLIYEGWGKNQTYILAYSFSDPYLEDVTSKYTSNFSAALSRRVLEGVNHTYFDQSIRQGVDEMSSYFMNIHK